MLITILRSGSPGCNLGLAGYLTVADLAEFTAGGL